MRVAIVFRTNATLSGGSAKHMENLVPLLRQDPRVTALDLMVPAPALEQLDPGLGASSWGDSLANNVVKRTLADLRPDVVFIPTARWFALEGTPVVSMVRNMEPLTRPFAGNSPLDRAMNLARRSAARRACMRADRIIAVSDYVRSFLTDQWGVDAAKVGRVYHGVSATPVPPASPVSERVPAGRPFFFCAGNVRPAKGLEDVIGAMAALRERDVGLVIAGDSARGSRTYHRKLLQLTQRLGVDDRVTWLGTVTPAEVAWCMEHCAAMVVTTRVEACPNAALEAMAHGCVIVSTDCDPMPEFFRETALYYRPGAAEALTANLRKVFDLTEDERRSMTGLARTRAADFTWATTATQTVDELAKALR